MPNAARHDNSTIVERFLSLVRAVQNGDPRRSLTAYRTLTAWPAEDREELIFRTIEKYAAEKRRLIAFNNRLVREKYGKKAPDSVLMLLPFCLQSRECPHRVAWRIENCRQCGRCPIGDLRNVAEQFHIPIRVAIRATFAPDFVREVRPELVLAVACEHDLMSGMMRVAPCDCYCVLNERPEGPCKNTKVDVDALRDVLVSLLKQG